jgi:hypothetical protein
MTGRPTLDQITSDDLDQLYDQLDHVRALHQPQPDGSGFPNSNHCTTCSTDGGDGYQYLVPWPCPTIAALDESARTIPNNQPAGTDAPAATEATDKP